MTHQVDLSNSEQVKRVKRIVCLNRVHSELIKLSHSAADLAIWHQTVRFKIIQRSQTYLALELLGYEMSLLGSVCS